MSVRTATLNEKGLTLVEVLVALIITLVLFMALMQGALLSISANASNVLRNEAVTIAEQRMREGRTVDFDALDTDPDAYAAGDCPPAFIGEFATGLVIERDIRNIAGVDFCTNMTVSTPSTNAKQINLTVGWMWQGEEYDHRITTLVRRP